MTVRIIQVGTGNQGEAWCRDFLPPNVADDTVEVVAAVDPDDDALERGRELLGLPAERCYASAADAVAECDADALALVVPPGVREPLVDLAVERGLDLLCEKPLADTMAAAARITRRTEAAGLKVGVTMTQRYRRDVTTLRRRVRAADTGPVDSCYCRYAINARSYGTWKPERLYDVEGQPMLVEGSIHHLDLLADLVDERVRTVFCNAWNPPHSDFAGDPNVIVHLVTERGTSVSYEGLNTLAETFNGWGAEHIRVDCSDTTFALDGGEIRRFDYDPREERFTGNTRFEAGDHVDLNDRGKWGNAWLIEQFADWCAGGEPMTTNARDNLRAMALVFAAVESAETGEAVAVDTLLADVEPNTGDE
ncbi:Gfo/Idh/MocA family protein [Halococcus sp. IIIV-5B]|uniref:Gfo/Idh/MocA family protein n=1 Tax=Halococcus sp. IIIV-5B TaxID=2321230 RepID=UPI000E718A7B|nr:Gfo/Idh/MocA family oxidoreductase [Halococcus sp. IIIV-5B]RJT07789.1 gfo/Idh/MocA family oxidoreductase [Halococcus sp. IIIV-5B]